MASTLAESLFAPAVTTFSNPKPAGRVCFSYAAYAKNIIDHLRSLDIPVEGGLSDAEISAVESNFGFSFPPDLSSILREGLPVGPGFPNWRSASAQQLEVQTNLPVLGLCKEISRRKFWIDSWGKRPEDSDKAVVLAKRFLRMVPILVPIYRHFYIPSAPCLEGNPVFYVHGGEVKVWSFDLAGFFQRVEFTRRDQAALRLPSLSNLLNAPAWAATEARRIEFWTELVEAAGAACGGDGPRWWGEDLDGCLEEVARRLRNGGWKEEDVREMMMMDGGDQGGDLDHDHDHDHHDNDKMNGGMITDREGVAWRVRSLSKTLLRAGWSTEDVVDSLGSPDDDFPDLQRSCFDFHYTAAAGFD
nr:ATP-dependent 6-phosphofructokinase [Ipomoea batatas]